MEKVFHTTDPMEADSLESELEQLSIDYQIQEEPGDSGLTGFTFYVSGHDAAPAIQRAKVVRARSLSDDPEIDDFHEASSILKNHQKSESERMKELSAPALVETLWRFRRWIATALLPATLPIGAFLAEYFQFTPNVQANTTLSYIVALGVVIGLLALLHWLLKPRQE